MIISLIAAVGSGGELGRAGDLIWRIPEDLKSFKRITVGHHIVLGRKTFESIGRALPKRTSIVLTRDPSLRLPGCLTATSLSEAIELARLAGESELIICGGEQVYREALPLASRIYLTRIHEHAEADVYFPVFEEAQWEIITTQRHPARSDESLPAWTYQVLHRRE